MRKILAFYPFNKETATYVRIMQSFLQEKYEVIDYNYIVDGKISILAVDVLYLNWKESDFTERDISILRQARVFGKKIVWIFHNRIPHDSKNVERDKNAIRFLIDISNVILIHSKRSINYLLEYKRTININKVHYIPHVNFIGDYFGNSDIREKMSIAEDTYVFAMYGRIRPYKNIELLIDAFSDMEDCSNSKLLIVGIADDKQYFRDLCKKAVDNCNIHIIDKWISSLEMKSYITGSDVVILPYDKRSSMNSGVMIMAFSYGRTVIVPSISMADDFDEQLIYKYDYINSTDHVLELKKEMEKAYHEGKKESAKRGIELKKIVAKDYSKDIVKKALLECV